MSGGDAGGGAGQGGGVIKVAVWWLYLSRSFH